MQQRVAVRYMNLLEDGRNNLELSFDSVKVAKMTPIEFNIFFSGKLLYAFYMFVLPSLYGVYSAGSFLSLYVASQVHNQQKLHF